MVNFTVNLRKLFGKVKGGNGNDPNVMKLEWWGRLS